MLTLTPEKAQEIVDAIQQATQNISDHSAVKTLTDHLIAAASDGELTRDEAAQLRYDARAVVRSLSRDDFREIARGLGDVLGLARIAGLQAAVEPATKVIVLLHLFRDADPKLVERELREAGLAVAGCGTTGACPVSAAGSWPDAVGSSATVRYPIPAMRRRPSPISMPAWDIRDMSLRAADRLSSALAPTPPRAPWSTPAAARSALRLTAPEGSLTGRWQLPMRLG